MSESLRVVVVDDDPIVRGSIPGLIEKGQKADSAFHIEIVGEASNGEDAIALVRETRPDVALMDLQMAGRVSGAEAIRTIRNGLEPPKVLALTAFDDTDNVRSALAAGATGYVVKAEAPEKLVPGIVGVYQGKTVTSSVVTEQLVADFLYEDPKVTDARERIGRLNPAERAAARLLRHAMTYEQIGAKLHVSAESVKKLLAQARKKTGVQNSTELAVLFERARLD